MLVKVLGKLTFVRLVHPLKKLRASEVTPVGNENARRLTQPENPLSAMLASVDGRAQFVRELQPRKALSPITLRESGVMTCARFVHCAKAPLAMLVTEAGTEYDIPALLSTSFRSFYQL